MYIQMGAEPDIVRYEVISNISFAPSVDLTGDTLQITELTVDVATADSIAGQQYIELRDALGGLWARFWLHKVDPLGPGLMRLYARSDVALMDDVTLSEVMYDGDSAADVFEDTMLMSAGHGTGIVGAIDYDLDAGLAAMTVTGYCPEQTARERLQWLCVALGAVVKSAFVERLTIVPRDDTATLIPLSDTYMRPAVSTGDLVTSVAVTSYAFSRGNASTDDLLSDSTSYTFPVPWVAEEQRVELVNPEALAEDPDNAVEFDGIYLINSGNDGDVISRLSARNFARTTVELDVINNRQYIPGDRVIVYTTPETLVSGTIESASFSFGVQAKSRLMLVEVGDVEAAALTVNYTWEGMTLATERRMLPVGYAYSITTRYLDQQLNGHRYIFRPTVATVAGTLTDAGATEEVPCEAALDLYNGVLHIISVDSATLDPTATENVVVIA